jgi:beta-glucanase (GH16 family)
MSFMKSRREVLIGATALAAAASLSSRTRSFASSVEDPTKGMVLDFDENFAMIDPAVWFAGPKPSTSDPGFYGRSAFSRIGGEEGYNPYAIVDDPSTENGKALKLSVRHIGRQMHIQNYYGNDSLEFQWLSGNIQTAKPDGTILKGWREGYFEARIWFPAHPLTWPAFWLMNGRSIINPKTTVELDVIEQKGSEHDLYGAYLHEWGDPGGHHEGLGVPTDVDITKGYFRYGLLIEGGRYKLYFERKPVVDPKTLEPVNWPIGRAAEMEEHNDVYWPILTLALLADVPYPNPLKAEDHEAHMLIDYVKVFIR